MTAGPVWTEVPGVVVRGHRVASGDGGDARYPEGTIRLQTPHFRRRGLDLRLLFPGTLNVSIAPRRFHIVRPRWTFRDVAWAPGVSEDFSFCEARVRFEAIEYPALVYYPHPETKPEHHQPPDVLELLAPYVPDVRYGTNTIVLLAPAQVAVT